MASMKYIYVIPVLLLAQIMCNTSCAYRPLPEMGSKKVAGQTYTYEQMIALGFIKVGKPRAVVQPTQMDATKKTLRQPAKWSLWVALPGAFLAAVACGVAVVYCQNPRLAKLCAVGAVGLFAVAMLATAWLIATTWMWAMIPGVILFVTAMIVVGYKVTKGKRPYLSLHSDSS